MRFPSCKAVLASLWLGACAVVCAAQTPSEPSPAAAQTFPQNAEQSSAQNNAAISALPPAQIPARITEAIDEQRLVRLAGNVHPLARAEFDRGSAGDAQPLHRMLLLLQRSAEQEAPLRQLLDDQQSKSSPNYQRWLTPAEFGQQFGPADADVQAITQWLAAQGFTDLSVSAGRTVIEFSGNAGQVRRAFHTEIHQYAIQGETHFANASDPQIPAALAPVVAGLVSLNNFRIRPHVNRLGTFQRSRTTGEIRPLFTFPGCQSGNCFGVGPADFATIYNTAPLLKGTPKIDGSGQGIAIVGESSIDVGDVTDFRTMFGLPANFTSANVIVNGITPDVNDSEVESDLDVQWSGAVAPGAKIDFVTSASTETTSGIHLSAVYIVDHNLDGVMSESFGNCEKELGTALNKFYSSLWEQAAAQGITVVISAGDGGSAGCDDFNTAQTATQGLAVSGFASTPFDVAVGGTDFDQSGKETVYWSTTPTSTTPPVPSSAKSYIPEIPWNESCAQNGLNGCKTASGNALNIVAGSGGASTIYAKPSWQTGKGVPNDNHRDIPDVSLFAGSGFKGSFYIICQRDAAPVASCDLTSPGVSFQGIGGTSASAPAFAGIMALVNQKLATAQNPAPRQGNANYVLYGLAAQQNTANLNCNSSTTPVSGCNLNDVTKGNNAVPCTGGSPNCSSAAAAGNGVLVATAGSTTPAYTTTAGYDLATGLGSVNAQNVVNKWATVNTTASTTTLALNGGSAVNVTHGHTIPFVISVTPAAASGDVALNVTLSAGNSVGVGPFTLQSGSVSGNTKMLPGGTQYNVTAHYEGNGTYAPSDSAPVALTVTPEASKVLISVPLFDFTSGNETSANVSSLPYGSPYLLRVDVGNASGTKCDATTIACPTGSVTLKDNGQTLDAGTYALNSGGFTEDQNIQITQLPGGTHAIVGNYGGDGSYAASTATDSITIAPAATDIGFSALPSTPFAGVPQQVIVFIATQSYGKAPTGTVSLFEGTTHLADASVINPINGSLFTSTAGLLASFNSVVFHTSGLHTITAKYAGDGNYAPATSTGATISVYYRAIVTVTPSATTVGYGDSVSFTAVIDTAVANLAPTGTVIFVVAGQQPPVTYSQITGPSGHAALQATIPAIALQSDAVVVANYNGDSNYLGASGRASVHVIAPDFSVASSPATLTISAGQQVSSTLTITPLTGSTSTATLNCSQPFVTGITCSVSPSTVNLANSQPVSATLTLSMPAAVGANKAILKLGAISVAAVETWWLSGGIILGAGLLLLLIPNRQMGRRLASVTGACAVIVAALGCGGGSSSEGGGGGGGSSGPVATSTVVTVASAKVPMSQMVTLTATVSSSKPVGGTITFYETLLGGSGPTLPVTSGMAQAQFGAGLGIDQWYAKYSGDAANQPSQSPQISIIGTGTGQIQVSGATGGLVHALTVNYTVQ